MTSLTVLHDAALEYGWTIDRCRPSSVLHVGLLYVSRRRMTVRVFFTKAESVRAFEVWFMGESAGHHNPASRGAVLHYLEAPALH